MAAVNGYLTVSVTEKYYKYERLHEADYHRGFRVTELERMLYLLEF